MGFFDILSTAYDILEGIDAFCNNIQGNDGVFEQNLYITCKYFNRNVTSSNYGVTNTIVDSFGLNNTGDIYVAYDASFWNDGAEGIVITKSGIYGKKPFSSNAVYTSYQKLSNLRKAYIDDDNCIYAGGTFLGCAAYLSDSEQEELLKLVNDIRDFAIAERIRVSSAQMIEDKNN